MQQADVIFFQSGESVEVMLFMDGHNILNSRSMESVVRELQIRQVSRLGIEQLVCAELPTSKADLARAERGRVQALVDARVAEAELSLSVGREPTP